MKVLSHLQPFFFFFKEGQKRNFWGHRPIPQKQVEGVGGKLNQSSSPKWQNATG